MDTLASIVGIIWVHFYELVFRKSFLHYQGKTLNKIHWFLLSRFSSKFKALLHSIGYNKKEFPAIKDLKYCRTTNKDDLKIYFKKSELNPVIRLLSLPMSSSGSTGNPHEFQIFITQWIYEQARVYASFRLGGFTIGQKMVIFRSYKPKENEADIKTVRFKNWTYFNSFKLNPENLYEYYYYLINNKIKFLRTYPSTLEVLLNFIEKEKLRLELEMIHVSSENISVSLIDKVEKKFGCRVINYYGQVEQAITGINIIDSRSIRLLPFTSYHIDENYSIISTNLINLANPLINYKTGDLVEFADESGGVIIKGRDNIFLNHKKGYKVSTVNFYTFMHHFHDIKKWQIIQHSYSHVELIYEGIFKNNEKEIFIQGINDRLGIEPKIRSSNSFHLQGEGKINPIINLIR